MFSFDPVTSAVLIAVIPSIILSVGGGIAVLVRKAFDRVPSNLQPVLHNIAQKAVLAASQVLSADASNPTKKEAAMASARNQAAQLGVKVDDGVLSTLIEASVAEMKMANVALSLDKKAS